LRIELSKYYYIFPKGYGGALARSHFFGFLKYDNSHDTGPPALNRGNLKYFLRFDQTPNCGFSLLALLALLYSKKKDKTERYYTLKETLYSILLMEASIEPEKIVTSNLHSNLLKLLLNGLLIALSSSKT
jgi:hypothetical protein